MYLKTLYKVIDILKDKSKNSEIIELCDAALKNDPYEEAIHIHLMDAMIKVGDITNAVSHFKYATLILERELGAKPTPALKKIERKIEDYYDQKSKIDFNGLNMKLDEKQVDGPMQCSTKDFKILYNIEKRKSLRENEFDFICIITLDEDTNIDEKDRIKKWADNIPRVLNHSLRAGDAFTFWNEKQFIILLHDVRDDGLKKIENRIRKNMKDFESYSMTIKFEPIVS